MAASISVIIPTHYRNDLLSEAIESVVSQDYEPVELIVVDDSGEGHAKPVLETYQEVIDHPIVREENGGWAAAYTTGIESSSGEYIQFLDDDDFLLEGKLTQTAEVLRDSSDIGVAYCGVFWGDKPCYPKPEVSGEILEYALRFQTFPLWTGSMLMEREILLDCLPLAGMGPDDDLEIELGDTDLKIELAKRTKFDYVNECLVHYRREENKLWTGPRRFQKVKQNVRHQQEVYDEYPSIRRALLADWYQNHGIYLLEEHGWSVRAVYHFLTAVSYASGPAEALKHGAAATASLFGRPGWSLAKRTRDTVKGSRRIQQTR